MGMTLRLDTSGLRSLIEDNPDFKIEIQKSVMNNINQDNLDNAVRERLESLLRDMCTVEGGYYNQKLVAKDTRLVEALNTVVKDQAKELATTAIQNIVNEQVNLAVSRAQSELRATVKESIIAVMTTEMAKEILLSKLV